MDPCQVSFASAVTVLGVAQSPDRVPVDLPDIPIYDPVCPDIPEEDDMDVSIKVSDVPVPVFLPPPPPHQGLSVSPDRRVMRGRSVIRFCLTFWRTYQGGSLGDVLDNLGIRCRCRFRQFIVLPRMTRLLPIWALPEMSRIRPSGTDNLPDALVESSRPLPESPVEVVSDLPDCLTSSAVRRSPGPVPRWRLAR